MTTTTHGNGRTAVVERPELEQTAAEHLGFHGWDMDWEELTTREGLKVFARAKDSTLYLESAPRLAAAGHHPRGDRPHGRDHRRESH